MNKATVISIVLAILLVAGSIFAAADFLQDEPRGQTSNAVPVQGCECGCGGQCGGSCGEPNCGCNK